MIWREFKAMGTEVTIMASLDANQQEILIAAEKEVLDFSERFSRFIDGNELSQFNNSDNTVLKVSPTMAELLQVSQNYYQETGGIFDPTIIGNLETVGYNQSFDQINSVDHDQIDFAALRKYFINRPKMTDLQIDGQDITRPKGFKIDLGGIGKGYVVDYLQKKFLSTVDNYWISAGGDIVVAGHQANNSGWDIAVQNPLQPEEDAFVVNTHGKKIGIATSGVVKRKGTSGDFNWHHIIDPRSGLPADDNILAVTIISESATRADVLAKTVLILGVKDGLKFLERSPNSVGAIFIKNGPPIFSPGWSFFSKQL